MATESSHSDTALIRDVVVFRPSDGAFAKWYDTDVVSPDFNYQQVRDIGGQPYTWVDAQIIPTD